MTQPEIRQEVLDIADYLGWNGGELWNEFKNLLHKIEFDTPTTESEDVS